MLKTILITIIILGATTPQSQTWMLSDMGIKTTEISGFATKTLNATFRSKYTRKVVFTINLRGKGMIDATIRINNCTAKAKLNKNYSFEGTLKKINTIIIVIQNKWFTDAIIYGNSTIKAEPKQSTTQNKPVWRAALIVAFIAPITILYIFGRKEAEYSDTEEEVILL